MIGLYWLLNAFPLLVELGIEIYALSINTIVYNAVGNTLMWIWILILRQAYLLCINIIYINKHMITYKTGIICMLDVIIASVGIMVVFHKMQYGVFIGDVPGELYFLLIIIPFIIVLIGMGIFYSIKGRQK